MVILGDHPYCDSLALALGGYKRTEIVNSAPLLPEEEDCRYNCNCNNYGVNYQSRHRRRRKFGKQLEEGSLLQKLTYFDRVRILQCSTGLTEKELLEKELENFYSSSNNTTTTSLEKEKRTTLEEEKKSFQEKQMKFCSLTKKNIANSSKFDLTKIIVSSDDTINDDDEHDKIIVASPTIEKGKPEDEEKEVNKKNASCMLSPPLSLRKMKRRGDVDISRTELSSKFITTTNANILQKREKKEVTSRIIPSPLTSTKKNDWMMNSMNSLLDVDEKVTTIINAMEKRTLLVTTFFWNNLFRKIN